MSEVTVCRSCLGAGRGQLTEYPKVITYWRELIILEITKREITVDQATSSNSLTSIEGSV